MQTLGATSDIHKRKAKLVGAGYMSKLIHRVAQYLILAESLHCGRVLLLPTLLCFSFAVYGAPYVVAHDSFYRGVPIDGANDRGSDIGIDKGLGGFRVGDIVYEIETCSTEYAYCMVTPYLSFEMPIGACQSVLEWRTSRNNYECKGRSVSFFHLGTSLGDVFAIVQVNDVGRRRVFYFSQVRGVVLMQLDQFIYWLQSPLGIGAASPQSFKSRK